MARVDSFYIKGTDGKIYELASGDEVFSTTSRCYYSVNIVTNNESPYGKILYLHNTQKNGTITTCGGLSGFKRFSATDNNLIFENGRYFIPNNYKEVLLRWIWHGVWSGGKAAKYPQPSAERVVVKGRNRIVYVGPKGGRYIKSKGKFVRL